MNADTLPAVRPGTYRIDPVRSTVRFTARHAFGLGPVQGTLAVRDGHLTVAEEPTRSSVAVRLDPASFRTDKARRDADIKSRKFLDVERYPDLDFTGTAVARRPGGWVLTGILTVRGTSVPVELSLDDAAVTAAGARFTATTRVDRFAFGVTAGRGLIGRHLDVALEVWATPA